LILGLFWGSWHFTREWVPDGKPFFYIHGAAISRLEPAMLDGEDLEKAGIRLIACDRPGMGISDFQPERGFSH